MEPTRTAPESERAAVARYFTEIEAVEAEAKTWSDPMAMAQSVLRQAAEGDTGGFDDLIASQRRVRDRLAGMTVPEACREHHRATVEVIDSAVALLADVKQGIAGGYAADLTSLSTRARELERRAREVDTLAAQVKARLGL